MGTRKRAPPGTMLELNGGYDESPAEDSDGPAAGRRQRAQNRAGACLSCLCPRPKAPRTASMPSLAATG